MNFIITEAESDCCIIDNPRRLARGCRLPQEKSTSPRQSPHWSRISIPESWTAMPRHTSRKLSSTYTAFAPTRAVLKIWASVAVWTHSSEVSLANRFWTKYFFFLPKRRCPRRTQNVQQQLRCSAFCPSTHCSTYFLTITYLKSNFRTVWKCILWKYVYLVLSKSSSSSPQLSLLK